MSADFGAETRRLRHQLGWSLRRVAAQVPINPGYLSRIEGGTRHPTPEVASALDTVLGAAGALTLLAEQHTREGVTRRRQVLHGLGAAGLAAAGLPLPPPAGDLPRRIGMGHVADLDDSTSMYRAWVARHGGTTIRAQVDALLYRACQLHAAASHRPVRAALLHSVADLAGLGGYIARDAGAHADAEDHFRVALSAATACGDTALRAHTVVRMAGHGLELHQPATVLTLLDAARTPDGPTSAGAEANRCCLAAWGHAQAGNAQAVHRAVGQAEEHQSEAVSDRAAGWAAQHVTEAELYSLTGAAYVDLARSDPDHATTAIDRLSRAIDLRGISAARNRTLDLLSLTEALLLADEVDEAGRIACRAYTAREGVASGRLDLRFRTLRRMLRPHAARSDAVAAFLAATR